MKTIGELELGFSDAQNYSQRKNKKMFSEVFVRNRFLDQLLKPNTYYLIGEKGTGKTAYAVYLSNGEYKNTKSFLKYISGTDYETFFSLKQKNHLDISGFTDIWKTILLLLLAKSVTDEERVINRFTKKNHLDDLMEAIDEYYNKAFSPEIVNALRIMDKSDVAAKLICQYAEVGASEGSEIEFTEQRLQMNLFYICKQFSECLGSLKLTKDITLFIDGIDVRPKEIPYEDYIECIKGLAAACWTLNTELFANVRDSKGQFKIVLLLRPDIFDSLNLQNATNKLADNSVYLDWRTTYTEYPESKLYKVAQQLLEYNQKCEGDVWEKYLPWQLNSTNAQQRDYDTAFMEFLKISLCRPRDIQRILSLIKEIMEDRDEGNEVVFSERAYRSDRFQNAYSEYFLGSLKDQLAFYYSDEEYRHFIKFFEYFNSSDFTYDEFLKIHGDYVDYILENAETIPLFVEDARTFLQLLYDSNVIAAITGSGDGDSFYHFSYREKSISNITPEVPYEKNVRYRFHYGIYKKGRFGRF